ncbi:MAG: MerR family DNA-binding transcriptional regulator [bacterium]
MEKIYINIKEASEMLGVSKLTLRNWDRDGKLTALRHPISNYRVYKSEDIKKMISKMESGEKPIRNKKPKKLSPEERSKVFKVKVLHLKD